MNVSAPQALRIAEEEQRAYVSHILAALLAAPSAIELDAYKMMLGDIAARMDVAARLGKLASQLESSEKDG